MEKPQKIYMKATFGQRLVAYVIDSLLILGFGTLTYALSGLLGSDSLATPPRLILLIGPITYGTVCLWKWGATLGKRMLKLKVVTVSNQPLGVGRALLRESVGKWVSSILNLGFLWMLVDREKQTWHDKLAKTYVVKLDQGGQLIPIEKEDAIPGKSKFLFLLLFLTVGLPTVALSFFVFLYLFVASPQQLKGSSMSPHFVDGQYFLVNKLGYVVRAPQRGDTVVFRSPVNPDIDLFQRIIGLPGEEITVKAGMVYIDGQPLPEPYLAATFTNAGEFLNEGVPVRIPRDYYVTMGDNRLHSSDSRTWGFVPRINIIGKYAFCYWGCAQAGN